MYCYSAAVHRERRHYLRAAMQELSHILVDVPGLLGPKVILLYSQNASLEN